MNAPFTLLYRNRPAVPEPQPEAREAFGRAVGVKGVFKREFVGRRSGLGLREKRRRMVADDIPVARRLKLAKQFFGAVNFTVTPLSLCVVALLSSALDVERAQI